MSSSIGVFSVMSILLFCMFNTYKETLKNPKELKVLTISKYY